MALTGVGHLRAFDDGREVQKFVHLVRMVVGLRVGCSRRLIVQSMRNSKRSKSSAFLLPSSVADQRIAIAPEDFPDPRIRPGRRRWCAP